MSATADDDVLLSLGSEESWEATQVVNGRRCIRVLTRSRGEADRH